MVNVPSSSSDVQLQNRFNQEVLSYIASLETKIKELILLNNLKEK